MLMTQTNKIDEKINEKANLAKVLEDAKIRFNLNQTQLAARIRVSQTTISQWLKPDSTQFPSEENRKSIARALGMTEARLEAEIKGIPFDAEPSITMAQVADYLTHCNLREWFLLLQDTIYPRCLRETRLSLVGDETTVNCQNVLS